MLRQRAHRGGDANEKASRAIRRARAHLAQVSASGNQAVTAFATSTYSSIWSKFMYR
jgi:hypothetical protein